MMVFPNPLPKLNVTNVAGTAIVDDANAPVIISLPTGTPANQTVQVKARDFGTVVPIRVLLVPENGDAVTADATIDNSTTNPAIISVPVTVPINTAVNVQVFAR